VTGRAAAKAPSYVGIRSQTAAFGAQPSAFTALAKTKPGAPSRLLLCDDL